MGKKVLTASEAFDLRQVLHVAALDALMASRRWEPGELIFQGGTSLHLVHGSPRMSEDLDFMVDDALKLDSIATFMQKRMQADTSILLPNGSDLSVVKSKGDSRNPHAFVIKVGGANMIGGVRVKIELWKTPASVLRRVGVSAVPIKTVGALKRGAATLVPTADVAEIYADKVVALAARPYLKSRDVFDLFWLQRNHGCKGISEDDLTVRLGIYPNETLDQWLDGALRRRDALPNHLTQIDKDLREWLPSYWPLRQQDVEEMVSCAILSLDQGIDVMKSLADQSIKPVVRPKG